MSSVRMMIEVCKTAEAMTKLEEVGRKPQGLLKVRMGRR
jgi:hypothetical protein